MIKGRFSILLKTPAFRYLSYLILLLPVFLFRDFTPMNELKYISIVEESFRDGNWFSFYNQGEIYADKPPLFFWLLMFSKWLTGGYPMWLLGLFSLLPAIGVLAVMDKWFLKSGVSHNPLVSNLLLLTTVMFTGASLIIRMDMLMTFFIVLSLYTFFRIYKDEHAVIEKNLLPVYIFLAVFSKGPLGFLIPVLSMVAFLALKKELRCMGRYFGGKQWAILLTLSSAWFMLIYWESGWPYLHDLLFRQTVGRGINSFHHKKPLWYYLPRLLWSFAPWVILYIPLLWRGVRKRLFTSDTEKFFWTIITVNFILLSLISAKLDIYLLPLYPFAVYLCAAQFCKNPGGKPGAMKTGIAIPAVVFTLAFPGAVIATGYLSYDFNGIMPYFGAFVLSVAGLYGLRALSRNRFDRAVIRLGYGFLLSVFIGSFSLHQFNRYFGFRELAESAKEEAERKGIGQYAYYKFFTGPNINVYLGQPLECITSVEQLDSLDRLPERTILFVKESNIRKELKLSDWMDGRYPGYMPAKYGWYVVGGN